MTKPNITQGPWNANFCNSGGYDCMTDSYEIKAGEQRIATLDLASYGQETCEPASAQTLEQAEANAQAIAAVPDLLAALESALESLQYAVAPLRRDGATGSADDCEDSAKEIKAALTKAGYTFP